MMQSFIVKYVGGCSCAQNYLLMCFSQNDVCTLETQSVTFSQLSVAN